MSDASGMNCFPMGCFIARFSCAVDWDTDTKRISGFNIGVVFLVWFFFTPSEYSGVVTATIS